MDHTCHRSTSAVFDVCCCTCDRTGCRDTAEQGGNDITCTLGNKLCVGAVLSADHAVCNDAGKQGLDGCQDCDRECVG